MGKEKPLKKIKPIEPEVETTETKDGNPMPKPPPIK